MQYYTDFDSYTENPAAVVTLGKFECLHLGHQKLIQTVQKYAVEKNLKSVAVSFDMGGRSVLTNEERRGYLEGKIDCLIQCPFTKSVRETKAEDFIENVLVKRLSASYIVTGGDFRFGYMAAGDVSMLKKYEGVYNYKLIVLKKERYKGREISSTYVREALEGGDVNLAAKLLGRAYRICGVIEHGKMLGRKFGFPTLNIAPPQNKLTPRFGVYTCRVTLDGRWYFGIGNIGIKPTVSDENRILAEIFLFGYDGSAYGKQAAVEFCAFRRPEMKFCSVEELKRQVESDIEFGKSYFHMQ